MRGLFALIFAASGAAALIYEVTWTRLLTLSLGHGVAAASTVLAAFMGGLAAGSAWGGRAGVRLEPAAALRVYAGLEIAIALLAILLPLELAALDPILARAYADGAGGAWFAVLRLISSMLLVSVPAAAMGATFPVASRWFVQHANRAAADAGSLYAANTIGAALGALLAGFVLLPALGLTGATWIGVALNIIAAAGAWWISQVRPVVNVDRAALKGGPYTAASGRPSGRPKQVAAPPAGGLWLAAAALGISGFASLTLQVIWTRLLALIFGPTTYAFSTMVAVFIGGLAAGAALASRMAARSRHPVAGLAICVALAAGLAAAAAALVDLGLLSIARLVAQPDTTFNTIVLRQAVLAVSLLAPMTIAFGAAFPFAVAVATRSDNNVASDLGVIYAVNTTGAIAGALLAGFVLIPWLGLHASIRVVTIVTAVGALAIAVAGKLRGGNRVFALAAALGTLGLGIWLPPWDQLLLSSGAYKYAASLRGPDLETALRAGRLLYYREGVAGTVAVRTLTGTMSLAIDGKVDASNAGDMLTQRLLAHVPLLLHPDPKQIAILGLGSGVTLGSALTHPIDRADVLEISSEVAQAARFFDKENHRAVVDPRTRMIIGDGRTHLLMTRQNYDVIVSEPSNPWMAGIASLFTREFFQAARDRLAPGGILCQWAHTYDISTSDLKSIVATFISVFPDGSLWLVGDGDVLLIGSNTPIAGGAVREPPLRRIYDAWDRPGVRDNLATVGALEPFHLFSMFVADGPALAQWSAGAGIQTDRRMALEFSGPRTVFGGTTDNNAALLRDLSKSVPRPATVEQALASPSPTSWRDRGFMFLAADAYRPAYEDFARAAQGNPNDSQTLDGLIRASTPLNRHAETRGLLSRLATDARYQAPKLALSRLLAAQGEFPSAVQLLLSVLQSDSNNIPALEHLASILSDMNDVERMEPVVVKLRSIAPGKEATHYYAAALLYLQGHTELALREARAAIALNPSHAKAHNLVGACLASMGQRDQARAAFEASIAADPRDPATYENLANLELQGGNRALAHQYFAEALTINPDSETARRGLEQVRSSGG